MNNAKLVYGFTKSKAYGLCGVALAMAFLGAGSVSADEVSTQASDVTTAVVTQAEPSATQSSDETNGVEENQAKPLEKADLIVTEVTPASATETTVPATTNLTDAINQAKEAGLEVSQGETVNKGAVKSAEEEAAKVKVIEGDYAKQAESIKKEVGTYKKAIELYKKAEEVHKQEVAKRDEALKNPKYNTADDAFSKQDLDGFLKDVDLTKLSYVVVNENTPAKLESNLKRVTLDDFKALFSAAERIDETPRKAMADLEAGKEVNYFHVKVGDTWTFKNVFVDASTKKPISLKYTYKGGVFKGASIEKTVLLLKDGVNIEQLGQEEENLYKVEFIDEQGKSVKVDYVLLGFGDLDFGQYVGVYSDNLQKQYLAGSEQTVTSDKNGLISNSRRDFSSASSAVTAGQFWALLKGASGFEYKFGEPVADWIKNRTDYIGGQWHQLGNIAFGIDIPLVSAAPTKPKANKLSYNLESYAKKGDLKVRVETTDGFVFDEKTYGNLFADTEFNTGKTKDKLVTINGRTYRVVEVKGEETGKIELGSKEVVYVVKEQFTTTWVTEGGEPLKDPNTGDEIEPHGEFPDYEFVKTNPKPDGSVEHVFKKVETPKEEPTSEKPSEPSNLVNKPMVQKSTVSGTSEAPKSPSVVAKASVGTLPETGTVSSILGLVGAISGVMGFVVARKKKED